MLSRTQRSFALILAIGSALVWGELCVDASSISPGQEPAAKVDREVVVLCPDRFLDGIQPWVEMRESQGFRVELIPVSPLLGEDANIDPLIDEIQSRFKTPVNLEAVTRYVLLIGDAPAPGESLDPEFQIPTSLHRYRSYPSRDEEFASDQRYGPPDESGRSAIAVGRLPVRSVDELGEQIAKIKRYEQQEPSPVRSELTFLATTPNHDPITDPLLEKMAIGLMNSRISPMYGLRALYGSPRSTYFPGPRGTATQVRDWLRVATPMTLFAGHGYPQGVDYVRFGGYIYPVLNTYLADRLDSNQAGTVLWFSACSCGDFDLAQSERCLAEALVLNPTGPVAVVAGSDRTSAYPNLLHCLRLAKMMGGEPPVTLGDAFVSFKVAAFDRGPSLLRGLLLRLEAPEAPDELARDHQYLYNLLGDPTLQLKLPVPVSCDLKHSMNPADQSMDLCGSIAGVTKGRVTISLSVNRMAHFRKNLKDPLLAKSDLNEEGFRDRFAIANNWTVATVNAEVIDGKFKVSIPGGIDRINEVKWARIYVVWDGSDGWKDGIAAVPLDLAATDQERNGEKSSDGGLGR